MILHDELAADPAAVMRDLYLFLGVDGDFAADVSTRHNAGAIPRVPTLYWMLSKSVKGFRRVFPSLPRGTRIAAGIKRRLVRPADPLPPAIRRRLIGYFRDDVARTGELIGRDLSHWLESSPRS